MGHCEWWHYIPYIAIVFDKRPQKGHLPIHGKDCLRFAAIIVVELNLNLGRVRVTTVDKGCLVRFSKSMGTNSRKFRLKKNQGSSTEAL